MEKIQEVIVFAIKTKDGIQAVTANESYDIVQILGFESEIHHAPQWASENGYKYKYYTQNIIVNDLGWQ